MKDYEQARELIIQIIKTRTSFRQTLQRVLKCHNIDMTFEMLQVMNSLWHEQGVSQQMLAGKTAKDKACLTNLMTNMEKRGWIIRKENPADRRNRLVYLTPEGEEMNTLIRPVIKDVYSQAGIQMGTREIEATINQLKRLDEIFSQL